ncbi:MAG: diaminopimelate decarboxylase [Pseudoflavonifractor sp.]|nr:diaminopimelate decarboxylase [Alloprevotella sp.]MCM1116674.1 diaminopimelate decarboxylase [Pseudoflavonifractor sp.]
MFPIDLFKHTDTPFYYYDMELLKATLRELNDCASPHGFIVHYAMKANANPDILEAIRDAGLGIDAVSGWEIRRALDCGFAPESIVFAGVGKTDHEIRLALEAGISCFNVESEPELEVIADIAAQMGVKAHVALRVNPNIDAHTHAYITTGLSENKFGIPREQLDAMVARCIELPSVKLEGLHFHIGSQITEMEPFLMLADTINELQDYYAPHGIMFRTINVGGGLGIDYDDPDAHPIPDFRSYFDSFASRLNLRHGQQLHFELGRAIVAQCGSLITRVLYVKKGLSKQFAIVDAGFTDLIRPALYQAHHKIENITASADAPIETYDVVGPICESSDCFATAEPLPLTRRGDLLALRSAGAYGEIMASQYNCRPLPNSLLG